MPVSELASKKNIIQHSIFLPLYLSYSEENKLMTVFSFFPDNRFDIKCKLLLETICIKCQPCILEKLEKLFKDFCY